MALSIRLIGPMAVSRDGAALPLPASRKSRALLAWLAVADRPARREHLCELLWELPDDPKASLRWSLSKVRGLIEPGAPGALAADRDTVTLDCACLEVDWRDLRTLAASDLRMVDTETLLRVAAFEGGFLEGLDLPRCDGIQAWLTAMREDVRRWRMAVVREALGRGVDEETARWLGRALAALDPDTPAAARPATVRRDPHAPPKPAAVQSIRFCTASDGTSLAYSTLGTGPPLLKAANWLNHLEYDLTSPIWRHWTQALTEGRRLVRYDERGNGLSDWDTPDISFEAFVDDLESVADAAGLDRFDLLGISQGASVAIAYAVRHPERVNRLVLYGGYAAGWRVRATPGEVERREAMRTLARQGWGQNNPAFRQMFTTLFFPDASPEEADWFNELQRLSTSPENAERLQSAFGDIDVRALLGQVRAPTLVLHAREDAVVPFAAGRQLAAEIPGAEFVAMESRNHLVLEHEPAWRRLTDALNAFLA